MYTDKEIKEIRERVDSHMRREQECMQRINETITFKLRLRAEEIVSEIVKDKGLQIGKDEFDALVERAVRTLASTPNKGTIVVTEIEF